jgi:hypothetical protein
VREGRGKLVARVAIGGAVAIVVLVALAQVLVPGIAERSVRGKLEKYGSVESVRVRAWPAVKLIWKEADEMKVSAGRLRIAPEQAAALLKEASGVDRVLMNVRRMEVGGVGVTDAKVSKHGDRLRVEGVMSEGDIRRALPEGLEVALVKSEGGTVEVRASGGLFGVGVSVDAVARAEDGKLVLRPTGLLLSGLKLTVFESASVYVEGVEARPSGGKPGEGPSYRLSMWASLR